MIKVYFESGRHAELVATFESESVYMACLPILEVLASEQRMTITESVADDTEMNLQNREAYEEDPEEAMRMYNKIEEEAEWKHQQEMLKEEEEWERQQQMLKAFEENNSVADDTETETN